MSVPVRQIIIKCQVTKQEVFFTIEDYNDYSEPLSADAEWEIYNRFHNIIREEALRHDITWWTAQEGQGETWDSEM